jgi:hypothetical protein
VRAAPPWFNRDVRSWIVVLAGCGRIGFDPGSIEPPPTDAITTFTGPQADPLLLPLASGQREATTAPGATLAANESYVDPASGVRVWKLTDAQFPVANVAARVDRERGGAQVSAAWDGDNHTVSLVVDDGVPGLARRFLIDVRREVGIGDKRETSFEGGEDMVAFTTDPVNPRIAFMGDGGSRLHRVDTVTNAQIDSPPFPLADVYTLPNVSAGGRVIVAQSRNTGYLALDTATGIVDVLETGGDQLAAVDHGGRFVTQVTSGTSRLWRIGEASTVDWTLPTGGFQTATGVTGGFVSVDIDTGGGMAFYFSNPVTRTHRELGNYGNYDSVILSSQWIQTDVDVEKQWILYTTTEQNFDTTTRLDDAIGFLQLTGDLRFLTHHYGPDDPSYYQAPRASLSPDGRMVVFTSTMGTGRTDVYVAEVPLSQ